MKNADVATTAALTNAAQNGIAPRNFVYIKAKNRTTGAIEEVGFWNGLETVDVPVIRPSDGAWINRTYHGGGSLLHIPSIPAGMALEVRTLRLTFSRLAEAVINAVRGYDTKLAPIEIHRGFLDPNTMRLVAPAICRFDGFVNHAPIKVPEAGGEGSIEIECVPYSRMLTRTNGAKFSDEMLKKRSGDRFGRYLDVAGRWRASWGEKEKTIGDRKHPPKERFRR